MSLILLMAIMSTPTPSVMRPSDDCWPSLLLMPRAVPGNVVSHLADRLLPPDFHVIDLDVIFGLQNGYDLDHVDRLGFQVFDEIRVGVKLTRDPFLNTTEARSIIFCVISSLSSIVRFDSFCILYLGF